VTVVPLTGKTPSKPPRVQSVARATDILNTIAASPDGATVQEITQALGLNRATAYHLLHTLGTAGYVTQSPERRYRIGLGVGSLVAAFERHVVPGGFIPLARELAARTGETAYVAMRQRDQLVLLCSLPGHHAVGVASSPIGPIDEGHARASGKLLLALAPEEAREAYLAAHSLKRLTPSTITRKDQLQKAFERIRADGYALDDQEFTEGAGRHRRLLAGGLAVRPQRALRGQPRGLHRRRAGDRRRRPGALARPPFLGVRRCRAAV
jgi:IclR family acetate operon transcriptional repressor